MGSKNKEFKERRKTISCGAMVYRHTGEAWDDTEILLVKQFAHKDNWGIPKGHIDDGETIEECAIRETREEAGVDIVLGDRLSDVLAIYKKEDKTVVSFLAQQICDKEPNSGDPDSEVAAVSWFKIGELPQIITYQREIIAAGLDLVYTKFRIKREQS